jgi:predicted murein hydrolase (TIGR00659 family)
MWWNNPVVLVVVWSAATIALYRLSRLVNGRWPHWWTMPILVAPILVMALVVACHTSYSHYIEGTHWLVALLGPATVAFALPIYEQRGMIRRHWPVLVIGILVGSVTAMVSAWAFASLLGLGGSLRLSLVPRSMSTPFAMTVSGDIGGVPDLTAVFVLITGVIGAALGDGMLHWLRLRSVLARGALFGMGAHAIGTTRAHQIGREEGSIAGLVMVLVGLVNVLAAPLLAEVLR